LANMVVFENKGGYIEMRIDDMLYDYMTLEGFECEFGYFENDFPVNFDKTIETAGLFCEPYSSDVYHITYQER